MQRTDRHTHIRTHINAHTAPHAHRKGCLSKEESNTLRENIRVLDEQQARRSHTITRHAITLTP